MDTTKPSRELDAAVARALKMKIAYGAVGRTKKRDYFWYDSEMVERPLPHFSQPKEADKSAVLYMILWLMERNIVLLERTKEGKTLVDLTDGSGDTDSNAVEGEPLQALALALCQVVVRLADQL